MSFFASHRVDRRGLGVLATALLLLGSTERVSAQTYTWNTTTGDWDTTTTNWLLAGSPSTWANGLANIDIAEFAGAAGGTVTLTEAINAGSLTFTGTTGAFTINGSPGLTLNTGITVTSANTVAQIINAPIVLGAANVWTNNSTGLLTIGTGGVTGAFGLTIDGSGNTTISGNLGTTTGGLTKGGSGTLTLSGTNGFTGQAIVAAGSLLTSSASALGAGGAGNETIVQNGATLNINGQALTMTEIIQIAGTGVGGNGALINTAAQQTNALNRVVLTADASVGGSGRFDIRVGTTPTLDLAGFTLTKVGSNQFSLVATTVTNGNVAINTGSLSIETTSLVQGTGTITIASTGTLALWATTAANITRPIVSNAGIITNLGTTTGVNSPITLNAGTTSLNVSGVATTTLGGVISGTGLLSIVGNSQVSLNGVNTYTGGTSIDQGRVNIGANSSAFGTSTVTVIGDGIVSDGQVYTTTAVLSNNFVISGSGGNSGSGDSVQRGAIRLDGGTINGTITLAGNASIGANTGTGTINGVISGGFNFTKVDVATIVLNGANNYTSKTTIGNGTLVVSSLNNVLGGTATSSLGAPTTVATGTIDVGSGGNAGTLLYTGIGETTDRVLNFAGAGGGGFLINNGTGLLRFNSSTTTGSGAKGIFLGGSADNTIDSTIVNNGGVLNFTKNNSNTVTLSSGLNTGIGGSTSGVTVNGGTLILGGASTTTGATNVNAGTLTLAFDTVTTNILATGSAVTLAGGTLNLTNASAGSVTQTTTALSTAANTSSRIVVAANTALTVTTLTANAGSSLNFNTAAGGADASTTTLGTSVVTIPTVTLTNTFTVTDAGGFGLATRDGSNNVVRQTPLNLLPAAGAVSTTDYQIDNNGGGSAAPGSVSLVVSASQSAGSITVDTTAAAGILTLGPDGIDPLLPVVLSNTIWNFGGVGTNSYQILVDVGAAAGSGLQSVASGDTLRFNNHNSAAVTIAAPILANGTNAVAFNGTGTTILIAANTYSGTTTIAGGVVNVRNATALGTVAAGTTVSNGAALQLEGNITVGAEALILNGTGINNTGALRNISGANTYGGAVTLGSNSLIQSDADTLTLTGTVGNGGFSLTVGGAGATNLNGIISGGGGLIKNGAGTLTLPVANTFSGGLTVNGGTVAMTGNNILGLPNSSSVTINTGATFDVRNTNAIPTGGNALNFVVNGGTLTSTTNTPTHVHINNVTLNSGATWTHSGTGSYNGERFQFNGTVTVGGTSVSTISGNQGIALNGIRTFNVADATGSAATDLVVSVELEDNDTTPGDGFIKIGAGTMQLTTATNSYTGSTTVNAGRLLISGFSFRSTSNITVNAGATLEIAATNVFVGGHGSAVPNTRTMTINSGTLLFSTLADTRIGNVILNNGATFTSNRGLAAFDVLLANTSTGAATISVTGIGASSMNGTGGIHLQGVQNFDIADVTGDSNADLTVSMILAGPGSTGGAAGGVNKLGAGTMSLSAANSYTGTTNVAAGTLLALSQTGVQSATGTGTVTVNGGTIGGILSGNGRVAGAVIVNGTGAIPGTISAGTGFGLTTLTLGNELTLGDGARYRASIFSNNGGLDGGEASLLNVTGNVTLGSTPSGAFVTLDLSGVNPLDLSSAHPSGTTYTIISSAPGTIVNNGFTIDYANSTMNGFNDSEFTLTVNSNTVVLNYTPVPEPLTVGLVATLGLAAAGWMRRRSRRA